MACALPTVRSDDQSCLPGDRSNIAAKLQGRLHVLKGNPTRIHRVVRCNRLACLPFTQNRDEHKMLREIAASSAIIGVNGIHYVARDSCDAGFLQQFPLSCAQQGFAKFDLATRKTPKPCIWWIGALNEQDLTIADHDSEDCRDGPSREILWRALHG